MKYRVRLSIPATVEVAVDVEAESQQEAIVAGYDHALAATPRSVTVISLNAQCAVLDTCEQVAEGQPDLPPPSPAREIGRYSVQTFNTPEEFTANTPSHALAHDDYVNAKRLCSDLDLTKHAYAMRLVDKLGNKLFEVVNPVGRFVVVAYFSDTAFAVRDFKPWMGWLTDKKQAKQEALALLGAGKVFAVGVLDANDPTNAKLVMNLSRSTT